MTPERRTAYLVIGLVLGAVLLLMIPQIFYVVDESELAVVLQFGEPVATRTESGLYTKIPLMQQVERLPRPRQFWEVDPSGILSDTQTQDGEKVNITAWAVWRITDPLRYIQQFRTVERGESRVAEVVRSTIRDVVSRHRLNELIRSTDRELTITFGFENVTEEEKQEFLEETGDDRIAEATASIRYGREKIIEQILTEARQRLAATISKDSDGTAKPGEVIELIDVGMSRIEFNDRVQQALFARQIARMEAIAARHEKEGEREAAKIVNEAQARAQAIVGEGEKQRRETLGGISAYEINQDADALQKMGDFYFFVRQLEALKLSLQNNSRIILTTDNEFFDLLRGPGAMPASPAAPTPSGESTASDEAAPMSETPAVAEAP
jgi:membrane protease subunit HflC